MAETSSSTRLLMRACRAPASRSEAIRDGPALNGMRSSPDADSSARLASSGTSGSTTTWAMRTPAYGLAGLYHQQAGQ